MIIIKYGKRSRRFDPKSNRAKNKIFVQELSGGDGESSVRPSANDGKSQKEKTSDDFCKNIDHFSAEKFKDTRKRILDSGNDCLREISDLIQCFDWNLNQEKLEEITKTRKIVKKTIFSPAVFIYEK